MPTWGQLILEINEALAQHGPGAFDYVRRKYLVLLSQHRQRNVILYATKWTQPGSEPGLVSITLEDVEALMEVVHGLDGQRGLDLILHSPGGSPDAAEAVVHYLRSKFADISVIVPQAAMSAATMLACASDRIVMGKHSSLGPIDPQFIIGAPGGGAMAHPAQAILDQFRKAQQDCRDPSLLGAWVPILPQYGPSLLVQCENALALAQELVAEWLSSWMLKGERESADKARVIAERLADHTAFKSHGRPIHRDVARKMGLVVEDLEADQTLQDLVLTVFHACSHVFTATAAVKIVENHLGRAFVKQQVILPIGVQSAPVQVPPSAPAPPR